MRRSRRLKASAVERPTLRQPSLVRDFLAREKGKVLFVILFSLFLTVVTHIHYEPRTAALRLVGNDLHWWITFSATLIVYGAVNLVSLTYLLFVHPEAVRTTRRFLLLGGVCIVVLFLARIFAVVNPDTNLNLLFFIPIAFPALVFAIVYNRLFAVAVVGYFVILTAVILHFHNAADPVGSGETRALVTDAVPVLVIHLISSMVAVLSVARIRQRSKLIKVGAVMGLTHAVLLALFMVIVQGEALTGDLKALETILSQSLWGILYGLVAGFLLTGALPFIEYLFEVSTDISLLELTDQNHPILRRLLLEAPGTYHHSFIVGTLAEAAADRIGANSLLARVGGYYHDIGKLLKPEYFTENESQKGSHHAKLTPTMSTLIIIAHIKDGIEIARDYNLPKAIIDFIPQHHGTSVVEYFFHEASTRLPGQKLSRDFFRYSGPNPRTREAAVVSLADSVEAASRSLSDPTPARLKGLVSKIIHGKLQDDQLDDAELNFLELKTIEETFVRVLSGIFHGRIAYPETARG